MIWSDVELQHGIYPSEEVNHKSIRLTPAMELKSHIIYIKEVPGRLWHQLWFYFCYQETH